MTQSRSMFSCLRLALQVIYQIYVTFMSLTCRRKLEHLEENKLAKHKLGGENEGKKTPKTNNNQRLYEMLHNCKTNVSL